MNFEEGGVRGSVEDRGASVKVHARDDSTLPVPHRPRPGIRDFLPPGMEIMEGMVEGARIHGPVMISTRMPPSEIVSFGGSKAGPMQRFDIKASKGGFFSGGFQIQAGGAFVIEQRTGSGRSPQPISGVRFTGPILLRYQGDVGQWYEVRMMDESSFLFISADGEKKYFGGTGTIECGTPEIEPFATP